MKKLLSLLLITSSIFLASCGCESTEDTNTSAETISEKIGYKVFETSDFAMLYPMDWEVLTQDDFASNVPASAIAAFRNNVQNEIFTASLGINMNEFETSISSTDFAKESLAQAKKTLVDFAEVESKQVEVNDEISTHILTYDGRGSATEPNLRFKPLFVVDGTTGYSLTSAFLLNEEQSVVKHIDEMLDSFTLK